MVVQAVEAQEWEKGAAMAAALMVGVAETMAMAPWVALDELEGVGRRVALVAAAVAETGTRNTKHLKPEPAQALDSTNETRHQSRLRHRQR